MTAAEFVAWLDIMEISGATAAQFLGVTPNTITRYRRNGGPKILGLACSALLELRMQEVDDFYAEQARRQAEVAKKRWLDLHPPTETFISDEEMVAQFKAAVGR